MSVRARTCTAREAGFTLVEVLVTLVLLAMVAAITMGSLRQVLDARARLRPYLDRSEETALAAGWFRQTVQAAIPDYRNGKDIFAATDKQFSGLTAAPIQGLPGTPTDFRWSLDYNPSQDTMVLAYREARGDPIAVARWSGSVGSFSYYGDDQKWRPEWQSASPLELAADPSHRLPQLPRLVRLSGVPDDRFPTIVAAPRGFPDSRPLPLSLMNNLLSQSE